ncbi:hypothetical protein QBC42DRAFT_299197 [Cladorrhinum samala]|uniref:Uncharacterized protein n=1 Tax=Cladorrhinum samala TaxID=585594 RepID=A0AAV9HFL5_9PEZI|nr:hypothetical protein QBC42DRAFT_299197 [Cladorrhinum samala]
MDLKVLEHLLTEYPIPDSLRGNLLKSLWGVSGPIPAAGDNRMAPYFDYYSKRTLRPLFPRQHRMLKTHAHIVSIASKISSRLDRADIHRQIVADQAAAADTEATNLSADEVDDAIDLCASFLVMAEVQLRESPFCLSGRRLVHWREGSLDVALAHHFTVEAGSTRGFERPRFERFFNAYNLGRIAGIKSKWTCNLVDHLRLVDGNQTVPIFHCVSFLQLQQSLNKNSLFPSALVQGTLDTLALLFPLANNETSRWLETQRRSEMSRASVAVVVDLLLGKCGSLRDSQRRLESFYFWRDRLAIILKQAFDES